MIILFREIFPPKDPNNPDPNKRIDCGEPTWLEQMTGRQQITFNIKGRAVLDFELLFRLFQPQLQEYARVMEREFPGVLFTVNCNKLIVHIEVDDLCDTNPLTVQFTPASYVHNQTYVKIRDITALVDQIYERILELHVTAVTQGNALSDERVTETNMDGGSERQLKQ